MLPGFVWISWSAFVLWLLESAVYGVFFGLGFAPLCNFYLAKVWSTRHDANLRDVTD